MRACALIVVILCGCDLSSKSQSGCPAMQPDQRSECATNGDLSCSYGATTQCECAGPNSVWYCFTNDCPPGIPGPGGGHLACAISDNACNYSDWEHDCSCSCESSAQGRWWSCVPGTIGSTCPRGPPPVDAGVGPG
jgi:hypothetical protein